MAQVDQPREKYMNDGGSLVGFQNKNMSVASTDAYVDILDIDCRGLRSSVITLHNTHATNDVLYETWATAIDYASITALTGTDATDYDNGWVQIKAETTLTASAAPTVDTLSNPYTKLVVRIKASSAGNQGTIIAIHRGEN
jgi:hypothetical protein